VGSKQEGQGDAGPALRARGAQRTGIVWTWIVSRACDFEENNNNKNATFYRSFPSHRTVMSTSPVITASLGLVKVYALYVFVMKAYTIRLHAIEEYGLGK